MRRVTTHVLLGVKRHRLPCWKQWRWRATKVASKRRGLNITTWLQPRKFAPLRSRFSGYSRYADPEPLRGKANVAGEVTGKCNLQTVVPVYTGRDSNLGFRTELENLVCDGKGKGASGSPVRPKVPMRKPGADCSIGALIRGNSRGVKGAGHPYRSESTGNRRNSISVDDGSLPWVARAG